VTGRNDGVDPEEVDPVEALDDAAFLAWYDAATDEAAALGAGPDHALVDDDLDEGAWHRARHYRALDHGQDPDHPDYGGAFDGFHVTSDADPGL
jgi:hypothetical protein